MAVIETVSAVLTLVSLATTIYFKRYKLKRFLKRQIYLAKLKYRKYRDRKATASTSISYMPVQELETVGLKHADNLEELENEIIDNQFPIEIVDFQEKSNSESSTSLETIETDDSLETATDAQTFVTAKEISMRISL